MLNELNILLTRENNDNIILANKIANLGGKAFNCPLLTIVPLDVAEISLQISSKLKVDIIIFISKNAAKYFFANNVLNKLIDPTTLLAAIGITTKKELDRHGLKNIIYPTNGIYSSASLLQILQDYTTLKNKNISIIKGMDGLVELKNSLITSGSNVNEISVYKRITPESAEKNIQNICSNKKINIILATSAFVLNNICKLTNHQSWFDKNKICLLVPSSRLAGLSCKLGFKQVLTAKNATDAEIIQTLIDYCAGECYAR